MALRFDGQVAVVTGAGAGLGRAYALALGVAGARVVVNDLGVGLQGEGGSSQAADIVTKEIISAGGTAVANYDSVQNGERIITSALEAFGRIDILINNAGILRDVSFKNMTDEQWDIIQDVHVRGAYKTTRAAWPHFRKQKYGRVILTSSAAGIYGNFGQCNYSAAKAAMIGFGETLAKEGGKYNILTNIIAPIVASRMTATVLSQDQLKNLTTDWVVPVVSVLVHQSMQSENGSIFEIGGGHVSKLRWERSKGALLKTDDSLTPGAVLANWTAINDFRNAQYPTTTADLVGLLRASQGLQPSPPAVDIRFDGRVAVVTGGGAGLGRAYCIELAKRGAKVVVNDLANPDSVVMEIRKQGGVAVLHKGSNEDGDSLIQTAIDNFGKIDILINNAGILRDKSFHNMTDDMWDRVNAIHLRATYKCSKAAYPYMVKQKYGRIVNTTSTSGTYGNFGQANYAAAKTGIVGFSRSLAIEGQNYNIQVNCISPSAGTELTKGVLPEEVVKSRKPEYVAAMVLVLSSEKCPREARGWIFESGCGWQARTRFQRSDGVDFPLDQPLKPEAVLKAWKNVVAFTPGKTSSPEVASDTRKRIMAHIENSKLSPSSSHGRSKYLNGINAAKTAQPQQSEFRFTDKDTILYNVSLGATVTQLPLVYENDPGFEVLPSFGVIPGTTANRSFDLANLVPSYSYKRILHGEQFLEVRKYPIPTSGTFTSECRLLDIIDKGKASIAIVATLSKDASTGEDVFYNETSLFIRDSGGFGGPSARAGTGGTTAVYSTPTRQPDAVMEEKTSKDQAALYRLNGDRNPLHIDPEVSKVAGFTAPILHGLCTFGIATKHIVSSYGRIKNIKVRFAGTVIPGQTLLTEMWREGPTVVFQVRIKDSGKLCISASGAKLWPEPSGRL